MGMTFEQAVDHLSMLGFDVVESKHVPLGRIYAFDRTATLHPLDLLRVQYPGLTPVERVMVLVDRRVNDLTAALDAAMEQTCTCFWTDPAKWFVYYGAAEPASQREQNPDCPLHGMIEGDF